MPAHNVVRIGGSIAGAEVWSINPRYTNTDEGPVIDYGDLLGWAQAIAGLNSGTILDDNLRSLISSACTIATIRCEWVGADGRLLQAAQVALPTPINGTGAATKPPQTAMVASLETGRPGRSYRGRIYWPALGAQFAAGSVRTSAEYAGFIATSTAEFLQAVGEAQVGPRVSELVVVSQTIDAATRVSSISVGDVLDTQRRRRDALTEGRTSVVFPPAP